MNWRVPLTDTTYDHEEAEAASRVVLSKWLTMGREVAAFEEEFAAAMGCRHGVAVSNGTTALHVAYEAAGLAEGEEFCIPAATFVATMNAGLYLRAKPVLVDVASGNDLTICADDLSRKITPRTRLIVTLPYGGFCPDMERILSIARERNIPVVEDACHGPLAEVGGKKIGSFGLESTWSFYGNKNLTTGEGGMVLTNDDAIAARLKLLRSHGMTTPTWQRHTGGAMQYDVVELGYNYRMDEIRAAIGRVQLRKLPAATEARARAAAWMRDRLSPLRERGLEIPFENARGTPAHHLFVVLVPEGTDRDAFRRSLHDQGVQTSMHYPRMDRFTHAKELVGENDAPRWNRIAARLVTLPMGPTLTEEQVAIVADAVRNALQ